MAVTWRITLRIWWSISWRCTAYSALLVLVLGFFGGLITALMQLNIDISQLPLELLYLVSLPVSMLVLHQPLHKRFI